MSLANSRSWTIRYIVRTTASYSVRKNHANSVSRSATAPVVPSLRRIVIELILAPRSHLGNSEAVGGRPGAPTHGDTDLSDHSGYSRKRIRCLSRNNSHDCAPFVSKPLSSCDRDD